MRYVERGSRPEKLSGEDGIGKIEEGKTSEYDKCCAHVAANGAVSGFTFSAYSQFEVKQALIDAFSGKCAYCEVPIQSNQPGDIEHFRPKGGVEGTDHPGYWNLAMSWENLLLSCNSCNRRRRDSVYLEQIASLEDFVEINHVPTPQTLTGKQNQFPLLDETKRARPDPGISARRNARAVSREKPLLIDPTRDDPHDHLQFFAGDISLVGFREPDDKTPTAPCGKTSISVYGLNRLGLVQDRTRLLRELDFLLEVYIDMDGIIGLLQDFEEEGATRENAEGVAPDRPKIGFAIGRLRGLQNSIVKRIGEMRDDPAQAFTATIRAWLDDVELTESDAEAP